jgi:hypothetical protein
VPLGGFQHCQDAFSSTVAHFCETRRMGVRAVDLPHVTLLIGYEMRRLMALYHNVCSQFLIIFLTAHSEEESQSVRCLSHGM